MICDEKKKEKKIEEEGMNKTIIIKLNGKKEAYNNVKSFKTRLNI